jgi:two-component system, NarL family, response regulator NreC
MPTRILLADDHPIVRTGLKAVLERETEFTLVGETGDGDELMDLVDYLKPDVVVLDFGMPDMGTKEITSMISEIAKKTRVVILSRHEEEAYVAASLYAGAWAYVPKKSASDELIMAIQVALEGKTYISPKFSEEAIREYQTQLENSDHNDSIRTLTPREIEILQLVCHGKTSKKIAQELGISQRTVEMHRANTLHKLDLKSTAELVRFSFQHGLLPPE